MSGDLYAQVIQTLNSFSDNYIISWFRKYNPEWTAILVLAMKVIERHHHYSPIPSIRKRQLIDPLFPEVTKRLVALELLTPDSKTTLDLDYKTIPTEIKDQLISLFVEIANDSTLLNSKIKKSKNVFPCLSTE